MSLGHGKDTDVHLNGRDATAYLKSADMQLNAEAHESTTMSAGTVTREGGLRDSKISLAGLYNGASNAIYDMIRAALSSANVAILCVWLFGDTALGSIGLGFRARSSGFKVGMPVAGLVTTDASFDGYKDAELLESLHPLGAETTTGNGTALDGSAATSTGGAVYVHCSAFTGTSITLTVEDSADNSSFATIATFTAITAGGTSERIEIGVPGTSGDIRRYVRVVRSGTFTSATFSVGLHRA